jgi:TolB-like protein
VGGPAEVPAMTDLSGAVFLSYASEDAAAAQKICATLRAASIEVWFDQSELRGGDAWDAAIRTQIKSCALFVPIISSNSRARTEGYFRLEWKLAVDRSHLMAAERPFFVPVVIDDTKDLDARVPEKFREVQWTHLPHGDATPEFVNRIRRLLAPVGAGTGSAEPRPHAASGDRRPSPRRLSLSLIVPAAVLIVTLVYIEVSRRSAPALPSPTSDPSLAATAGSPAALEKSIAVLPFTDLSEKKDQQYFSDGLSEELIDLLAQVPELKVTARTSSFSFRDRPVTVAEIGRELSVAHLLEGSVRKAGNTIRITAQLVRADNGFHLWSATYDRDLKDVFKVQDEIARVVVDKLKVALTDGVPSAPARTENTEAHNLLLQGTFALQSDTDEGTARSLVAFQRALALDPGYAAAWNGVGWAKFRRGVNGYEPVSAALQVASDSSNRAIELDASLADAYALRGSVEMLRFDWKGAAEANDRALQLDPANSNASISRALLLQAIQGSAVAIPAIQQTLDHDPRNLLARRYAARFLFFAGRLDDAEQLLRQILVISPSFSAAHYELGRVLLIRGKVREAVAEFELESNPVWRLNGLPLGYHAAGRAADAAAALADLVRGSAGSEFQVAEAYAYFGNADRAFKWLNKAVIEDPGILWLRNDPLCIALTGDARYQVLLKKMNLPTS